jgi:hypothetical protein
VSTDDGELVALDPIALVARTVNVYGVPATSPVMTQLVYVDSHDFPAPAVAVYLVIADPPLLAGATHAIVAEVELMAVAVTEVGASGATIAITTAGSREIETWTWPSMSAIPSSSG